MFGDIKYIENILNSNKQVVIFAKDRNLKYTYCNETLAEINGLDSPKQAIGKTDYDLIWKPEAEVYRSGDREVLRGKSIINIIEPQTQKSRKATILATKTVLTDKDGYPIGVVGHSVDITGYTVKKNNGYLDPEKNTFYLGSTFNNEYLTRREFEVFTYLLAGKSVEEIAIRLTRSAKTIQSQIRSITNKLQCSHKSEIVPTAIKHGLTYVLDQLSLE